MNRYILFLKSHSDAPDFEASLDAASFFQAVEEFYRMVGKYGWDKQEIANNTTGGEEEICAYDHEHLQKAISYCWHAVCIKPFCSICGYVINGKKYCSECYLLL